MRIFECRTNDLKPSLPGIDGARDARFDDDTPPAALLEAKGNKPIPASQIEDRAGGRKAVNNRGNTPVSMLEPEGIVFYFEASRIPLRRVRYVRLSFREPDPVFAEFQVRGDFRDTSSSIGALRLNDFHAMQIGRSRPGL